VKLLVIGSGGREHALVWKLAQSPRVTQMWCAPGNAGIADECVAKTGQAVECVNITADDLQRLLAFAREMRPDLTVVGPDNPLALGVVDLFEKNGLRIWGPNQKAAQFEASKVFSQRFMERHGIPTARAGTFTDAEGAKKFVRALDGRCAVKTDGLALGKGVLICRSVEEADRAIAEMLLHKTFGAAGASIVIQELLEGMEISLHALCDGKKAKLFPTAQDHKRALDDDQGFNTGGMGAYSPAPFLTDAELTDAGRQILEPWLKGCAAEGIHFKGILYPGVMLTKQGPKVLEFNARFGDPEAQVYLTRLENDLVELFQASIDGTLDRVDLRWSPTVSVCVVMASAGYPGSYTKGKPITGLADAGTLPNTKIFHAGTQSVSRVEGRGPIPIPSGDARRSTLDTDTVTSGGRVLGVTAWAETLPVARKAAYHAIDKIAFDGAHYRRDIAAKALPGARASSAAAQIK
jgi:phosphoribosylamine--glycine ligase